MKKDREPDEKECNCLVTRNRLHVTLMFRFLCRRRQGPGHTSKSECSTEKNKEKKQEKKVWEEMAGKTKVSKTGMKGT